MKRRTKKNTLRIDGVSYDRPLLQLPSDHPFVVSQKENDGKLHVRADGLRYTTFTDHRKALSLIRAICPDMIKMAMQSNKDCGMIQEFASPCGNRFQILYAYYQIPDADDPDRVESGWSATLVQGERHLRDETMKAMIKIRNRCFNEAPEIVIS